MKTTLVLLMAGLIWLAGLGRDSRAASVGIIGGADGPTAIFVTSGKLEGEVYAQSGPYGEISVTVPEGWEARCVPMALGDSIDGLYGIKLWKSAAPDSCIALAYHVFFGVCGTGLTQQELQMAGAAASVGTYSECRGWSFVRFGGENDGLVAVSWIREEDLPVYADAFSVLNTVRLDPGKAEGGAYFFTPEAEALPIGVQMSLKDVSGTGATVVMHLWDETAPAGELSFGSAYSLERQKEDGSWELLEPFREPLCFTAQAFLIVPGEGTECALNWADLCGELPPGIYRVVKTVNDVRGPGDMDSYELKACFVWGGPETE